MTFEETARRAGQDLREASTADVEAALAEFQRAVPRRRRAHVGAATLTAAMALAIALTSWRWLVPDGPSNTQPASQPQPTQKSAAPTAGQGCDHPLITCRGDRRYTVAMMVPMDWTIPGAFHAPYSGSGPTPTLVETYSLTGPSGGVTILQGVTAATTQKPPRPVPDVRSAKSFAEWLAQRAFLSASQVQTGSLDGHPTWSVDIEVKQRQPSGPATCNNSIVCYPIMLLDDHVVGTWQGMASRYTALDLPGGGVTVVWSWGLQGKIPPAANDLIASISFE